MVAVATAAKKVSTVNTKYCYVTVHKSSLLALPNPVVCRVVGSLLKFVSGNIKPVAYKQLLSLVGKLPGLEKTMCVHSCCVFPVNEDLVGMAYAVNWEAKPHPITIRELVQWNMWRIELLPVFGYAGGRDKQFFIRSFSKNDYLFVRRGVRVVRRTKLPPVLTRYALPVIVDQHGNVALIPHFKYKNRDFGISANVEYNPIVTLDFIIQQYD